MGDKKQLIIKEAVNLFATKGYHTTSVQEIAERCHIAKGSFYNYFKSKEELLLSCFQSGFDMSAAIISEIENDSSLNSREKFSKKILFIIELVTSNSNFIQMMIREPIHNIKGLGQLIQNMYMLYINWFGQRIRDIYPELPSKLLPDCTIILESIFKGYILILIRKPDAFEKERLASFILNRMDSVVQDLSETSEPLLKNIPNEHLCKNHQDDPKQRLVNLLTESIEREETDKGDGTSKNVEALQALQEEFLKENPSNILIEGLLLLLDHSENTKPSIKKLATQMRAFLEDK
jgi:AcrR family transcriptional regulator